MSNSDMSQTHQQLIHVAYSISASCDHNKYNIWGNLYIPHRTWHYSSSECNLITCNNVTGNDVIKTNVKSCSYIKGLSAQQVI